MKLKKWVTYIVILIILIWLIFFVDWGCESDEDEALNENASALTGEVVKDTETKTQELECPVCEFDDDYECPDCNCDACDSCCPSCPATTTKTVTEGAEELASESLVKLEHYNNRIINADSKNLSYWLYNTKDYKLNNIHTKLVVTIDDDTKEIAFSEVLSLDAKENRSLKLPITLTPKSEDYEAKLTIYAANNNGQTTDIKFKVHNLNPDIEESKAFWQNSIVGFKEYKMTKSNVNLTLVNNKNSDVNVNYVKVGTKQWFLNKTLTSGQLFEVSESVADLCTTDIYRLPVYMNYTSGGFDFEIAESQQLVGYCR